MNTNINANEYDINDTVTLETVDGITEYIKLYCGNFGNTDTDCIDECELTGYMFTADNTCTENYYDNLGRESTGIYDEVTGGGNDIVEIERYDGVSYCHIDYTVERNDIYYHRDDSRANAGLQILQEYHSNNTSIKSTGNMCDGFSIGFEIEKNSIEGLTDDDAGSEIEADIDSDLYWKVETDSSCGIEAVTNVLAVDDDAIRALMRDDWIADIDDCEYRCGGHVNMRFNGYTSVELLSKIKPVAGLIYSIWRKRLNQSYCINSNIDNALEIGSTDKYSTFNLKYNGVVECRVPSRVRSSKQLVARYNFFSYLLKYCVNNNHPTVDGFLFDDGSAGLFYTLALYNGDVEKTNRAISERNDYQLVAQGHYNDVTKEYIDTYRFQYVSTSNTGE